MSRFGIATIVCGLLANGPLLAADAKKKITYDDHIRPIFRDKCFSCHNTDKKTSGLDLSTYTTLMEGGAAGSSIEGGSPDDSYLWLLVNHDSEPFMPPKSDKMPAETLKLIHDWIAGGALENAGSKPVGSNKPKFDLTLQAAPDGKPAEPPMPGRLALEPVVRAARTTAITAIASNPWSSLVALASQHQVLLYDAAKLELLGVLPFPEGEAHVLKFSRNGALLLAAGGRGASRGLAVVWDVKTGERVFEVGDELDTVLGADISADQSMIALGGPSRIVRVFSTRDGELLYECRKHTEWIYDVAFSPDGVLLATADRNGGLFVWEAETGRQYLELRGHGGAICELSWRIDSNILASASQDTTIRLWEMENGREVKKWGAHGGGVQAIAFTRTGQIASTGRDKVTKLWDQNGKQVRAFDAFGDIGLAVSFCDEANRMIAGDWTGSVRVWNAADGKLAGGLDPNPPKIAERITVAMQTVKAREAEWQKLNTTATQVQTKLTKQQADLAGLQKTLTEYAKSKEQLTASAQKLTKDIEQKTSQIVATTASINSLQQLVPALAETVTAAQKATAAAPKDGKVNAVVKEVTALLGQRKADLVKQQDAMKKLTGEKDSAVAQKQQTETKLKQLATQTDATTKSAEGLKAAIAKTNEERTAATKAADAAKATLDQAHAEHKRWEAERDFVLKLQKLTQSASAQQQLEQAIAEATELVNSSNAELKTANEQLTAAQKSADQSKATVAVATKKEAGAQAEAKRSQPRSPPSRPLSRS